jgi:hypothetical protein
VKVVSVAVEPDRGETALREVPASQFVDVAAISSGGEVTVAARGAILLVDAAGHARNLTASSAAADCRPPSPPMGGWPICRSAQEAMSSCW